MATTCWLFYRDLWPRFRSGEAPPFTIDLAYEAQNQASDSRWQIHRAKNTEERPIGMVHTWVKYNGRDDTFELHSEIMELDLGKIGLGPIGFLQIKAFRPPTDPKIPPPPGITGMYRVTREGELREIDGQATIDFTGNRLGQPIHLNAMVHVGGKVEGSRFLPHGSVDLFGHREDLPLEPVEFNSRTNILNPLHPVSRITGLRRGQHWQLRLVDPLADSISALIKKEPVFSFLLSKGSRDQVLQAEVLPETEILVYEQKDAPCLIIEYRGDNLTARTWVREKDGKVLRQEATFYGEKLVLDRL
jgi:hypothetical protein